MKTVAKKSRLKIPESLRKLTVKKRSMRKKAPVSTDAFFSAPPVELGRTNNAVIDRILYGKSGA
jgi:hypothetical protein